MAEHTPYSERMWWDPWDCQQRLAVLATTQQTRKGEERLSTSEWVPALNIKAIKDGKVKRYSSQRR